MDDAIHQIIDRPHEYEIIRFDYHNDPDDHRNSFIDISLRRNGVVRHLRFLKPQRLVIDEGFLTSNGGMQILDIRGRQWDGLNVEVVNFEPSAGVTFCAADVIDLDERSPNAP